MLLVVVQHEQAVSIERGRGAGPVVADRRVALERRGPDGFALEVKGVQAVIGKVRIDAFAVGHRRL